MMVHAIGGRRARMMRLWVAQGGRCGLCGLKMPPLTKRNRKAVWTFDHVWPRRYGFGNQGCVVVAHGACNLAKEDRDPTGCELIMLATVNAVLGFKTRVRPGHVLELTDALDLPRPALAMVA